MREDTTENYDKSVSESLAFRGGFALYSPLTPRNIIEPESVARFDRVRNARWIKQKTRRAFILSQTRQLIAECGYERVNVRQIARRSGISVPTVHNLVGGRDQIVHEAVREEFAARLRYAADQSLIDGINPLFWFVNSICLSVSSDPTYCREVLRAIADPSVDRDLSHVIWLTASSFMQPWLAATCVSDEVDRHHDLRIVADLVNRQIEATMVRWSSENTELGILHRELTMGVALMLIGIADKSEALRINSWVEKYMRDELDSWCPLSNRRA